MKICFKEVGENSDLSFFRWNWEIVKVSISGNGEIVNVNIRENGKIVNVNIRENGKVLQAS